MFTELLEETVGLSDGALDEAIRAGELAARDLAVRQAALIAVAEHRRLYSIDGHRTMKAYLRASCDTSGPEIARQRKLAHLVENFPAIGDALMAGRFSVAHALEIDRIRTNPRIGRLLPRVAEVFIEQAEHTSYDDFRNDIDQFITLADQDGAFAELANNIEYRNARVNEVGGVLDVVATGGDPITAAQMVAVFESFVHGEYQADLATRRAEHGDEALEHPLPRTAAQRRFDALCAIFAAAAGSPEGRALPEPTVHILCAQQSLHEAFTHADVTLPNGQVVDFDAASDVDDTLLDTLADELLADPEGFRSRRCETSTGAAVHPMLALRAAMTGHIRRVVIDSAGVITDFGTKQRLFTGNARAAALLLAGTCGHPGCRIAARLCQVDHVEEWSAGGRTDQSNSAAACGTHNRFKHRERWRTRRDSCGRIYNVRPDGTIVLPVGERPPDLSIDEMAIIARNRLAELTRQVRTK